jgi:hypothetical protein
MTAAVSATSGSVTPSVHGRLTLRNTSLESEDVLGGVDTPDHSFRADRHLSQSPRYLIPTLRLRIEGEDFLKRVDPPDRTVEGYGNLVKLARDMKQCVCLLRLRSAGGIGKLILNAPSQTPGPR